MMRPLTLIVTGDPLPSARARRGDFARLFQEALEPFWRGPWRAVDVRNQAPPDPASAAGFIVSGSPASVLDGVPWMHELAAFLRRAVQADAPVLGVCFGHQILAGALGGKVGKNPRGREMGTKKLSFVEPDSLLDEEERPYLVNMTHVDSVLELPAGARVLGCTEQEPHAAVRFGGRAWGVQFHPEIDREVMTCYASDRRSSLERDGLDADEVMSRASDAVFGRSVLGRFAQALDPG